MFYGGSRKLTIYIARVKHGKFSNSAPCNLCIKKIRDLGIGKIKFTYDENTIVCCKTKDYSVEHKSKSYKLLSKYMRIK